MNKIGVLYGGKKVEGLIVFSVWMCLHFALMGSLSAQVLTGKVYTRDEKGDKVTLYMARLQWLNTTVGAYTNSDGSYQLPFSNTDTLIVRYSFYTPDTLIVNKKKRQLDITITTAQSLQEVVISKRKKPKYVRKGNPAVELVEKVIDNKDKYRVEAAECYKSKSYKKMIMTFGRFDMNFQKNKFNRQFEFLEKYIDTMPPDTIPVLTISLRETMSDHFYQKSPRRNVEFITAKRMQGADEVVDQEGVGTNLDAMFTNVNIFDNDIELMLNKFVSPLSSTLANLHYHYFITDTVEIDGDRCIELSFAPVNSRTFGFTGRMYIVNDSTYALKRYAMNVPVDINMNFVRQLRIEQDFVKMDNGLWAPDTEKILAAFSVTKRKKTRKIYVQQKTYWYDFEVGTSMPDSLSDKFTSGEVAYADVWKYKQWQWKRMRPVPLTAKESFIDSLATELRRLPSFKVLEKTAEIFSTGYISTAKQRKQSKFDIGPIYDMVSFNPTEGVRLRLGGMTTANLHDRWFVSGYLAFGCKDLKLKYNLTLTHSFNPKKYHINESPKNAITFSSTYDMEMPGQSYSYMDRDNIFMSYTTGDQELNAQYVRRTKLRYEREWPNRFSINTWLLYENNEATGTLSYWRLNKEGVAERVSSFNNIEWCLQIRWAPGERVYNNQSGKDNLIRLSKNAPVLSLTHTTGTMDRQNWYNKTDISVEKRFWLSAFGHIDMLAQAGIVWDAAPFPKLYVPPANNSMFLTPNTFCMMKPMEFIMDKYVSLYATYYLKGWIFNRIPLWNRLNFREVISFSGVYGGLSAKNIPSEHTPGLYLFPDGCGRMGELPYMEVTAGIENILGVLRIDYVRRLTYAKDLKGWGKNGIRLSFRISF